MNLLADIKGGEKANTFTEQKQKVAQCSRRQHQQHNSIAYNQSEVEEDSSWVLTRWLFGGGSGHDTGASSAITQDDCLKPIDQGSKIP